MPPRYNVTGTVSRASHDIYGQPTTLGSKTFRCSVARYEFRSQQVVLRSDLGSEHGHGQETVADLIILADIKSDILINDIVRVLDNNFQVTRKLPRYRVTGELDHYQVEGAICR